MPSKFERRNILRNTTLNQNVYTGYNITMHPIFLMGTEMDPFENIKPFPSEEEILNGDILQTDLKESHYGLVHKDYELFKFVRDFCPQADFVYKGDDDIFLNPDGTAKILKEMISAPKRLIHGCVKGGDYVNRAVSKIISFIFIYIINILIYI